MDKYIARAGGMIRVCRIGSVMVICGPCSKGSAIIKLFRGQLTAYMNNVNMDPDIVFAEMTRLNTPIDVHLGLPAEVLEVCAALIPSPIMDEFPPADSFPGVPRKPTRNRIRLVPSKYAIDVYHGHLHSAYGANCVLDWTRCGPGEIYHRGLGELFTRGNESVRVNTLQDLLVYIRANPTAFWVDE